MSWHCLPELVAESLAESCLDGALSVPSKWNPTLVMFCLPASATEYLIASLFGTTCVHSTATLGADTLTLSAAGSPAKTSALQAKARDSAESDPDSGLRWQGLWAKFDPNTCSLKTAQHSLLEDLTGCLVTLPRSGLMRHGECYQLPILAHPICGKESGLWPTPCATDSSDRKVSARMHETKTGLFKQVGKNGTLSQVRLSQVVKHRAAQKSMPTPTTQDNAQIRGQYANPNSGTTLGGFVRMSPTATASAAKGWSAGHNRAQTNDRLDYTIEREANVSGQTGRLNPEFVEWLMGWPIGHTGLEPLAMDKWREWQQKHSFSLLQNLSEAA